MRTDANPLLLPPPGVRADPTFRAHMARIETNRDTPGTSYEELMAEPNCATPPCTEGWRFQAIAFQHPPHQDLARRRLDILSIDNNTGVITVSGTHGYRFFDFVQVNAPGIHDREFHRACRVEPFPTADTFRCAGKVGGISGAYAGGGTVTTAISVPLEGCTAGSPVVCTTAEPHGFGNFHAFGIASIANGLLTTSGAHKLASGTAVLVEGTSGGAWDGIYEITAASGSTGKLTSAPGGSCGPCGGTVRAVGYGERAGGAGRGRGEGQPDTPLLSARCDASEVGERRRRASCAAGRSPTTLPRRRRHSSSRTRGELYSTDAYSTFAGRRTGTERCSTG